MDILSNLKPAAGSTKKRKRIGRGMGSGHGKTSTKGHKGQKSRSGYNYNAAFEGGQMPLQRRVPKFGFTNHNRTEYQILNLEKLQIYLDKGKLTGDKIDPVILYENGVISKKTTKLKILGVGDIKTKIEISAHKFSKTAKDKIEKIGGKVTII